jgi:hypothetical protein
MIQGGSFEDPKDFAMFSGLLNVGTLSLWLTKEEEEVSG